MSMVSPTYSAGVAAADYEVDVNTVYPMIEKVARQVLAGVDVSDRLAIFNKAPIANGTTIEEVVVKLAESTAYNINDTNPFDVVNPDLVVRYYQDWTHKVFKTTVFDNEIRKVMLADGNAGRVSAEIVASLSKGDIYEKYLATRGMLADAVTHEYITVGDEVLKTNYKGILKAIKDAVSGMSFPNDDFNKAGIVRETPKSRIYILMPYKVKNAIDVEELAGVFNLDKAEIKNKIIEIDEGDNIYIVDEYAMLVYTRLYQMASAPYNPDNLSKNFVLHTDRLYGFSELFDSYCIPLVDALTENASPAADAPASNG